MNSYFIFLNVPAAPINIASASTENASKRILHLSGYIPRMIPDDKK